MTRGGQEGRPEVEGHNSDAVVRQGLEQLEVGSVLPLHSNLRGRGMTPIQGFRPRSQGQAAATHKRQRSATGTGGVCRTSLRQQSNVEQRC